MSTTSHVIRSPRFAPPRSAYIHVPFCRHRCGYCNFTLVAGRDDLIDRYLLALDRELHDLGETLLLETLYFGGGTPSHLPAAQLERLLSLVRRAFQLEADCEFTIEMNPLDVTADRLDILEAAGVNRVSLGVQSFQDSWLALLERDHRREEVIRSVSSCCERFASVSIDLIFGVPGQTLDDWQADLREALALHPQHLSLYGLTFERGTAFWSRLQRGAWNACEEDLERQMYETAIDELQLAGFEHYEVSNFAQPGFRSRHNEAYWLGKTYYGAGPGAARHIAGKRELNHRSTTTYLQRVLAGESPVAESEFLSAEDAARERFVFGLRRLEGLRETEFAAETGFAVDQLFLEPLRIFTEQGLIERRDGQIRLTRGGLLVSDALWPRFLESR